MPAKKDPIWTELIQLVPVISLALPSVLKGEVDVAQAGSGFLIGALLFLPITALVAWRRATRNPILIGTGIWLVFGALAFHVPLPGAVAWLGETQAFGLFACALGVGILATFFSPAGFIGCRHDNARWVRRASYGLLALGAAAAAWAFAFRADVRVGGGLPFIVLNVARRVMIRRAP